MSKPTILAVDDQKSNRAVIEARLSDNYNVILASSGREALGILQNNSVDLILLDIMLDEQDGIEVCKSIKKNPNTTHIPIIFLTGMSNQDKIEEGFEAGASDYVIKNFNTSELKLRIKNQLKLVELSQLLRTGISNMQRDILPTDETKQELKKLAIELNTIADLVNKSCQQIQKINENYS